MQRHADRFFPGGLKRQAFFLYSLIVRGTFMSRVRLVLKLGLRDGGDLKVSV